jgi:hypothetical protein
MDGLTIQARINAGRGKAALRIGLDCKQYRPLSASAPLGNLLRTIKAAFNAGDSTYKAANLPGDAIWYADLDGSVTQPGDYLVRNLDGATFYIAAQQQLLPIICVECNRTVRITRQAKATAIGNVGYVGATIANETAILGTSGALWPASILFGGKQQVALGLPQDAKQVGWRIMLPPSAAPVIEAGDFATDDLGRRYRIDGDELTDLGWRMNCVEAHT